MHHMKLIVTAIVVAVVIIFGFLFWDDLKFDQQEISNTPLPPAPLVGDQAAPRGQDSGATDTSDRDEAPLSQEDDYDDLEKDLNQTNVDVNSDSANIESEMSGL